MRWVAIALGVGLVPSVCAADPRQFLSLAFNGAARLYDTDHSLGGVDLEVSYLRQLSEAGLAGPGLGGVAHMQYTGNSARGDGRGFVALAAQATFTVLGLEAGGAWRGAYLDQSGSVGVHLAPFVSLGLFHVELPVYIPLSGRQRPEMAIVAGVCLPLTLNRARWSDWLTLPSMRLPAGRPLRVAGRAATASRAALPPHHDADVALDEHAAIAAFARLSLQLLALGAPLDLVARSHAAALDEVAHTRLALGRCGAATDALPALAAACADLVPLDLATLAWESFYDGCIGEGRAARRLAAQARRDADPALARVAREESHHAALGWDIVAWALGRDGDAVASRLSRALDDPHLTHAERARLWALLRDHRGLVRAVRTDTPRRRPPRVTGYGGASMGAQVETPAPTTRNPMLVM